MIEIRTTAIFSKWFSSLKDRRAKARIQARIDRVEMGHFGDIEPVGDGISELRISTDQVTVFTLFRRVLLS